MNNRDYGTTQFKGETYQVTCEAWVDNKGSEGEVVYLAYATKDGKKYKVEWDTTEKYDLSGELYVLEDKFKQLKSQKYLNPHEQEEVEDIKERIAELEARGISSFYYDDGSNACDWENATRIWEVDEEFGLEV